MPQWPILLHYSCYDFSDDRRRRGQLELRCLYLGKHPDGRGLRVQLQRFGGEWGLPGDGNQPDLRFFAASFRA